MFNSFGFVISFMFIVYMFEIFFGDKVAQNFCLVVLLSMLIFNEKKLSDFMSKIMKSWNSKGEEKESVKKSNPVIAGSQKIVGVGI